MALILKQSKLAILLFYICNIYLASCIVLPTATKTIAVSQSTASAAGTPTAVAIYKRDDQSNLDLYQNWASMCRDRNNIAMIATDQNATDNSPGNSLSINNLWQTVTQTVNCGGGHALTVTKTITATSTSTPTALSSSGFSCTGQCWSDYLWRK
jgi:hypothetical protein